MKKKSPLHIPGKNGTEKSVSIEDSGSCVVEKIHGLLLIC
jgi:hypothetical protein